MTENTNVEQIDETMLPGDEATELPGEEMTDEQVIEAAQKAKLKGLSGHQKNRQLALAVYGDAEYDKNDFRLEFVNDEDRARATEELKPKARATKNGKVAIGGDRYLSWVKQQGFPEGMLKVVYPEDRAAELLARKEAREAAIAEKQAEREAAKAERDAEREAAKAAKAAEREAAKAEREAATAEAGDAPAKPKKSKKAKAVEPVVEDTDPAADSEFVEL